MNSSSANAAATTTGAAAPATGNPSIPPTIPDYELIRRVGGGAYGEVWLARSAATGVFRAVKIVYRATFTDDRPFNREFEGIRKFEEISRSNPSQLALFHVGRNDTTGCFYYVMELADSANVGQASSLSGTKDLSDETAKMAVPLYLPHTLRADLERDRLPAERVLELGLALTEALAHLHSHGLVHRDIKPSNIIFVNGRPKMADIGLVTDASDARSIVGTEGYLAPEGPGKPQADLFALGKVLYEALTGLDRRQFPELPADLRQWPDAELALELNAVLVKACAAYSQQGYASAEEMLVEIDLLKRGQSVKRQRTVERFVRLLKSAALIALLLTVIVVGTRIASNALYPIKTVVLRNVGAVGDEQIKKAVVIIIPPSAANGISDIVGGAAGENPGE